MTTDTLAEHRSCAESVVRVANTARGPQLHGYVSVWDSASVGLPFTEYVRRGAFAASLRGSDDIVALVGHGDGTATLGRRSTGTLTLREDDTGLQFSIRPPNTATGKEIIELVRRQDIRGASFGGMIRKDRWSYKGRVPVRELLDVALFDVSLTSRPAYPATSVTLRSFSR